MAYREPAAHPFETYCDLEMALALTRDFPLTAECAICNDWTVEQIGRDGPVAVDGHHAACPVVKKR